MKITHLIIGVLTAGIISGLSAGAAAQVTGTVLTTDIGAVIDGAPIHSYNVNGSTYVIAEDLRGYGFDVSYNDSERTLYIAQNVWSSPRILLSEDEVNIYKKSIAVGEWAADIYSSDIKVLLNGAQIEAYSLDGQMIIPVRALEACAYVEFDEDYRVARVYGLRWYMDELSQNGEAETEISEYTDYVYERKNTTTNKYEEVSVTEITAHSDKGGTLSLYIGNPIVKYSGGQYYFGEQIAREEYIIADEYGNETYRVHLQSSNVGGTSYAKVSGRCQTYKGAAKNLLYGIEVETDKEYSDYWSSDEEIAASDMTAAALGSFDGSMCVLTNDGYLFKLSENDERTLLRYNVKSILSDGYIISRDDTLYQASIILSDIPSVSSAFDVKIKENVRKYQNASLTLTAYTDGTLLNSSDKLLLENVRDFDFLSHSNPKGGSTEFIAALTESGELYVGTYEDYLNGTVGIAAYNVKSFLFGNAEVYFVNESNELYSYSVETWSFEKLSDSIASIAANGYYITTDSKLTDLSEIIAENVTAAAVNGDVYAALSDGTVYKYPKDASEPVRMYY